MNAEINRGDAPTINNFGNSPSGSRPGGGAKQGADQVSNAPSSVSKQVLETNLEQLQDFRS